MTDPVVGKKYQTHLGAVKIVWTVQSITADHKGSPCVVMVDQFGWSFAVSGVDFVTRFTPYIKDAG